MYWTMQAGLLMPIIIKSVELLMLGNMVGGAAIGASLGVSFFGDTQIEWLLEALTSSLSLTLNGWVLP